MNHTSIPIEKTLLEKLVELRFEYRARNWNEFWHNLTSLHPRCPKCGGVLVKCGIYMLKCLRCGREYILLEPR